MKQLVFLFIILTFFISHQTNAQTSCLWGGITFSSQSQIDSFPVNYPGCEVIEGGVIINGDDITNLDSLQGLEFGDYLRIYNNDILTSLEGLEGLEVGGRLSIHNNDILASLGGLEGLDSLTGDGLFIFGNPVLTSLAGLDSLSFISGTVTISNNSSLTSLSGLGNLTTVSGCLFIEENQQLTSLTGLNNLTSIGTCVGCGIEPPCWYYGLVIENNPALLSLNGLESLTSVEGGIDIKDNDALASLDGLDGLISVGTGEETFSKSLNIENNDALTSLNGLENLDSFEYIEISFNDTLSSISSLNFPSEIGGIKIGLNGGISSLANLATVTKIGSGGLFLNGMDSLESLVGLENITTIGEGGLFLSFLDQLGSLNGLVSLDSIFGPLSIKSNAGLTSLSGLEELSYIKGAIVLSGNNWEITKGLEISDNPQIVDLFPLQNVDYIGYNVRIEDNSALSACHIQSICDFLAEEGESIIEDNAPGCNSEAEVEAECPPIVSTEEVLPLPDVITIYPNPTRDFIYIEGIDQEQWNLAVMNTLGELIYRNVMNEDGKVDLSGLGSGLYFIELSNGVHAITKRVIKE